MSILTVVKSYTELAMPNKNRIKGSRRYFLYPRARLTAIGYALRGLRDLFKAEANAKIHALATIAAIAAGWLRHISRPQWTAIVFAIALVWMAEAFNTAIEQLCDIWCGGAFDPRIGRIKDLSAGAVLVASVATVVIAAFVFCS